MPFSWKIAMTTLALALLFARAEAPLSHFLGTCDEPGNRQSRLVHNFLSGDGHHNVVQF